MKKYTYIFYIVLILLFPLKQMQASYLSDIMDKLEGFTFCQIPLVTDVPGMTEKCAQTNPDGKLNFVPIITGRMILRLNLGLGCSQYSLGTGRNVALLGDSLTHYGGDNDLWNMYLGGGSYKVLARGAAGSTSSAWKDHFDLCTSGQDPLVGFPWNLAPPAGGYGRPQLPPRSIMMIGGNDFHVFKGVLKALWWAVPLRRLNTVNNIEKVITYHHQGNNGCGDHVRTFDASGNMSLQPIVPVNGVCPDSNGDGIVDYKDWGIGRLFVLLGNLPAVSLDSTTIPGFGELLRRLGLNDKPNDDVATTDNIHKADLTGDSLVPLCLEHTMNRI